MKNGTGIEFGWKKTVPIIQDVSQTKWKKKTYELSSFLKTNAKIHMGMIYRIPMFTPALYLKYNWFEVN